MAEEEIEKKNKIKILKFLKSDTHDFVLINIKS